MNRFKWTIPELKRANAKLKCMNSNSKHYSLSEESTIEVKIS
jgi:hypothetical protein